MVRGIRPIKVPEDLGTIKDKLVELNLLFFFWNWSCADPQLVSELRENRLAKWHGYRLRGQPHKWTDEAWLTALDRPSKELRGDTGHTRKRSITQESIYNLSFFSEPFQGTHGWRVTTYKDPVRRVFAQMYMALFHPHRRTYVLGYQVLFIEKVLRGDLINWARIVKDHVDYLYNTMDDEAIYLQTFLVHLYRRSGDLHKWELKAMLPAGVLGPALLEERVKESPYLTRDGIPVLKTEGAVWRRKLGKFEGHTFVYWTTKEILKKTVQESDVEDVVQVSGPINPTVPSVEQTDGGRIIIDDEAPDSDEGRGEGKVHEAQHLGAKAPEVTMDKAKSDVGSELPKDQDGATEESFYSAWKDMNGLWIHDVGPIIKFLTPRIKHEGVKYRPGAFFQAFHRLETETLRELSDAQARTKKALRKMNHAKRVNIDLKNEVELLNTKNRELTKELEDIQTAHKKCMNKFLEKENELLNMKIRKLTKQLEDCEATRREDMKRIEALGKRLRYDGNLLLKTTHLQESKQLRKEANHPTKVVTEHDNWKESTCSADLCPHYEDWRTAEASKRRKI